MKESKLLEDVVISVDSNEWYYGLSKNRTDPTKRILVKGIVLKDSVLSSTYANAINSIYIWTCSHERDTIKKKKRPFYTDRTLFVNPNFSF